MYVACPKGQRKRPSAIRVKAFPGKKKSREETGIPPPGS
jgi:hypothetical protein